MHIVVSDVQMFKIPQKSSAVALKQTYWYKVKQYYYLFIVKRKEEAGSNFNFLTNTSYQNKKNI